MDVCEADIKNACLQVTPYQKHYIICELEFSIENLGKKVLNIRALYGRKTTGRDFRKHLKKCMKYLGFTFCLVDIDFWMIPETKSCGTYYWKDVLLYTYDMLYVSERAGRIIWDEIGKYFLIK